MRWITLTAFAAPLLTVPATHAQSKQTCAVARATVFYDKLKDMPQPIQTMIRDAYPVAEASEPYNETDMITQDLPMRRFVLGGRSGDRWFVWLEHGGFAPHHHVLGYSNVYRYVDKPPEIRQSADFRGEPCVAINAFVAGISTTMPDQN